MHITKVVDGDTLAVKWDLGRRIYVDEPRLRLMGLNAPEHGTVDGDKATAFVNQWVRQNGVDVTVRTEKDKQEKYGGYLGTVYAANGKCLNDDLLAGGYAKAWDGKGVKPV